MRTATIHRRLTLGLQGVLALGLIAEVWAGQWLAALTTAAIILVTLFPLLLARRFSVFIPPEFGLLAVVCVFASLYLGEVHDYYARYWWWDIALHASSGFLLGTVGFLLVHLLNEMADVGLHMKPGFVAFFAFLFAIGVGALWEVVEFSMDRLFGMNMQKSMLDDPSGLTDTMWDLIVDTLGGLVIAVLGYGYIRAAGNASFLTRWIQSFVDSNPRLFKRP